MKRPYSAWCVVVMLWLISNSVKAQGYAISFDGYNDYLFTSGFNWNSGSPVTIEFWSYVTNADVQPSVLFRVGSGSDNTSNRFLSHAPWSDRNLYWDYGNIGEYGRLSVNYDPYVGQWTHVALVSAGVAGNFRGIYINGVLVASQNISQGTTGNFAGLTIGSDQLGTFHKGKIDEFRVWNIMRTQQQIFDNKGVSIPGNTSGLVAYYKFDEGSGGTTADASVNGFTATLYNSPTWVVSDAPVGSNPVVTAVSPAKNSYHINAAQSVSVTFNVPMNPATLNANTFMVFGSATGRHTGTYVMSAGNTVCTFTPTSAFKAGETVTVNLTSGVAANGGLILVNGYHWNYMIKSSSSTGMLSVTGEYAAGTGAVSGVSGDFNNDGFIDFAVVNQTAASMNIYRNNGSGIFTLSATLSTSANPVSVITVDHDNDGDLDIAVANRNSSGTVSIFSNDGTGGFYLTSNHTVGVQPNSLATGDFDGDGDFDLAVSNGNGTISLLTNVGMGPYSLTGTITYPGSPFKSVRMADVNSDGTLDLICVYQSNSDGGVITYTNDGIGGFSYFNFQSISSNMYSIDVADFTGDGILDIACTGIYSAYGFAYILVGNGYGSFGQSQYFDLGINSNPTGTAVIDIEGDGDLDILFTHSSITQVFINNGAGSFAAGMTWAGNGSAGNGLFTADFDGNGTAEPAIINSINSVTIMKNHSMVIPAMGVSAVSPSKNALHILPSSAISATFNKVLQTSSVNSQSFTVFGSVSGKHTGIITFSGGNTVATFTPTVPFKNGETVRVLLAKTIKSTLDEFLTAGYNWSFIVKTAVSSTSFALSSTQSAGTHPISLTGGDHNNDGYTDFSVLNQNSGNLTSFANNGYGSFSNAGTTSNLTDGKKTISGDFDNDGDMDLAAVLGSSNNLVILRNNGSGVYTTATVGTQATKPVHLASGDFDGDGDLDIVTANETSGDFSFFSNNGSGIFSFVRKVRVGSGCFGIAVLDFNGDGFLDLAATDGDNFVRLFTNDGTGSFFLSYSVAVATTPYRLASADLDGDGDADIVVINYSSNNLGILKNNGAGIFTITEASVTGQTPVEVILGDFSGDGSQDIAVANASSSSISVYHNNGSGSFAGAGDISSLGQIYDIYAADINGSGVLSLGAADAQNGLRIISKPTAPSPPLNVTASPGNGQAVISFNAPATNGGSSITQYTATSNPGGITGTNDGTTTQIIVSGLTNNTSYTFTVTASNSIGTSMSSAASSAVIPGFQASNILFSAVNASDMTLSWTNGSSTNRVVFLYEGSSGNAAPVNNTTYTANAVFGSGSQIGSSGWYCIYKGSGSSVNVSGLTPGASYRAQVIEYTGAASAEKYYQFTGTGNPANQSTIVTQASNVIFSSVLTNQFTATWSNGTGTKRAVFIYAGAAGTAAPLNNSTYTANPVYGSGSQIGSSGWYCVYNGTGNSVTITGVTADFTYRVQVVEYTGNPGSEFYFGVTGANNPANILITLAGASNIVVSGFQTNQVTLNWTSGSGSNRIVMMYNGSSGSPTPVNNTTYNASTVFGSGSQIGSSGWYCVYNGSGTSVSVSGLTEGQTYRVKVIEYFGNAGTEDYFLTGGADNPVNFTLNLVQASSIIISGVNSTQFTAAWSNGNGQKRAVFVKLGNSGNASPTNATTYTANANFGAGTQIGSSGWYCVYNGTGSSVIITGLTQQQIYRVHVFEYYGNSGSEYYFTGTGNNNPVNGYTPFDALVTSVSPAGNANNVSPESALEIRFNQVMNPDSLNLRTILVTGSVSGKHSGTITMSEADSVCSFIPATPFKRGEMVTIILTKNIRSATGTSLVAGYSWNFTVKTLGGPQQYVTGTIAATGVSPVDVIALDVDMDGDVDLVTGNQTGNSISVEKNDGSGNFTKTDYACGGTYLSSISYGDYDGDGDQDIVAGLSNEIRIMVNDGTGAFTVGFVASALSSPASFASGDIDNDGDIDLALGSGSDGKLYIYKNNGFGVFSLSQTITTGYSSLTSIAFGHFDNAGELDLVAVMPYGRGFFANTGGGVFGASYDGSSANHPSLVTQDFNNNGALDYAVMGNNEPYINVFFGSGAWTFPGQNFIYDEQLTNPSDLATGDLDGDGDQDILAVSSNANNRVVVADNNGLGQWPSNYLIGNGSPHSSITTADLNGDDVLDIACANYSQNLIQTYIRSFNPASEITVSTRGADQVSFSWTNGNGAKRIIFISQTNAGSPVPVNGTTYTANSVYGSGSQIGGSGWYCVYNAAGSAMTITGLTENQTYRIAVIEYAGGQGHEFYYPQYGINNPRNVVPMQTTPLVSPVVEPLPTSNNIPRTSSIKALYNQPMNPDSFNVRTFIVRGSISGRHFGTYVMSNGDSACSFVSNRLFHPGEEVSVVLTEKIRSITDVAPTRGFSWRFTVKTNAAPKEFVTGTLAATSTTPLGLIAADVDNDGDADIVTINYNGHNISVEINNGSGAFTQYNYSCGSNPWSLTSGDYDNDGDIDILAGFSNGIRLMLNDGSGVFSQGTFSNIGANLYGIATADIDNDGDIDFIGGNQANYEIYIAKNNGAGVFTLTQTTWGSFYYPQKIIAGDFENGGDIDFLVGFTGGWTFFSNNGSGHFSSTSSQANYGDISGITINDFNNNRLLDIVTSNYNVPYTNLYYGNGNWTFASPTYLNNANLIQSSAISSGDLDGDGDLDIPVSNSHNQGKIVVWDNISAGQSWAAYLIGGGSPHSSMVMADFDGDGMLDIACANSSQNLIQTYVHTVTQASALVNVATGAAQSSISWTNGNGGNRVVFVKEDTTGTPLPANLTTYTANAIFGSGTQIGSSGWYCVYNGGGNSVVITGLNQEKKYRIAVIEYAGAAGNENYFTKSGAGNPLNVSTSSVASSNVSFSVVTATQFTVNWIKGNGVKRAVFVYAGTSGSPVLLNNTTYTANAVFGTGSQVGESGWYCVYNDTGSNVTVTGLSIGNTYRTSVIDYSGSAGSEEYFTVAGIQNPANSPVLSAPLDILSVFPQNNSRLATVNTTISVRFNNTLLADSINNRTMKVFGSQTGYHSGTYSLSEGDSTAVFTPAIPFRKGESVFYTLTTGIKTSAGNALPVSIHKTFIIKSDDAAGTFTYTGLTYTEYNPQGLFTADFDSDGDLDIATGNRGAGSVNILKNNGSGAFNLTQYIYPGSEAAYITGADFENDGDIDLAVVLIGEAKVGILTNNGGGNFTLGQLVATASMPHNIIVADFTGDGIPDLGVAHWGGEAMSILGNNGSGSFSVYSSLTGIGVTGALCAGDFDGDGDIDVATSHYFESAVRVHLNNGSGFFTTYGYYGNIANPYILNSGDLNGDGFTDIAIAAIGENNVAILMNNGSAVFSLSKATAGTGTHGLSIGDIKGNGIADIITANISGNSATILSNNGSGSFTSATENFSFGTFLPVIADFNNDGRLDYVLLSHSESAIYTFINDAPVPLPVELASFRALVQEGKVVLTWTTATEVNNAGFDIEKAKDTGNNPETGGNLVWEKIGFVTGAGNSNSIKEYGFTDNGGRAGKYFYRLKQLDTDGKYSYSQNISAEVTAPREFTLAQNYPNPFNPSTRIDYQLPDAGFVTMKLYNIAGEEVRRVFSGIKEAGFHSEQVSAEGLSSGVYFYILTFENAHAVRHITKKLTLLR